MSKKIEEDQLLCENCFKVNVPDEIEYQFLSIKGEWYNSCDKCQAKLALKDLIDAVFGSLRKKEINDHKANVLINRLIDMPMYDVEQLHTKFIHGLTIKKWTEEVQIQKKS